MKEVTQGQCKGTDMLLLPLPNLLHFPFLHINFSNAHKLQSALMLNLVANTSNPHPHPGGVLSPYTISSQTHTSFDKSVYELPLQSFNAHWFHSETTSESAAGCEVADTSLVLIGKKHSRRATQPPQTPARPPAPNRNIVPI